VPNDAVVLRIGMPSSAAMMQAPERFLAAVIAEPSMTAEQTASLLGPDVDTLAQQLQILFTGMLAVCAKAHSRAASEMLSDWTLADLMLNFRVATYRPEARAEEGLDDFTRRVGVEA